MVKLGGEYLNLTGDNSKDIISIRDDIYKLKDDLQYYLSHIDGGNMTSSFAKEMTDGFGNYSLIRQEADRISARVSDLDGNVANLAVTASEIRSEVSAVDGRVTQVDLKADGISADVSDLDGRFTTVQQNVNGWKLTLGDGTSTQDITINGATSSVNLNNFDLSAKSLTSVTEYATVKVNEGVIRFGLGDFDIYNPDILFGIEPGGTRLPGVHHLTYINSLISSEEIYIASGGDSSRGYFAVVNIKGNDGIYLDSADGVYINDIPYGNVFCAYRSTNRTITPGVDTVVGFNGVLRNVGSLFYLDGGNVVCGRDGQVEISGQVDTSISGANGKEAYTYLYKNGSAIDAATRVTISSGMTTALCTPRIIYVSSGDILSPTIHIPSGSTGTIYSGAYRTFYTFRYVS